MNIIKLGGSLITEKKYLNSARKNIIGTLAGEIACVPGEHIIVHGAGSFGHIGAEKYGLREGARGKEKSDSIFSVQRDVLDLNTIVVKALNSAGIRTAVIPPRASIIFDGGRMAEFPEEFFARYLDLGLTPVSFGDVVPDRERGISICSGDDIMLALAERFRPDKCIFVTKVHGIYSSYPPDDGDMPLREIYPGQKVEFSVEEPDVTGSMERKLELMFRMAKYCGTVEVTGGFMPGNLFAALSGREHTRTLIRNDESG